MKRGDIESCNTCNQLHTFTLNEISVVACKHCGNILYQNSKSVLSKIQVPDDWSFVRIGTTGEYKNEKFTVTGRIRLQLRNDYKNFWCAEYGRGQYLWIVESHASFSMFLSTWRTYPHDPRKLRADSVIPIDSLVMLQGEYVEKCEAMSYEGELGQWMLFSPGFFLVQGSDINGSTALFTILQKESVHYILGEKVAAESLRLQNIHEWDEWK